MISITIITTWQKWHNLLACSSGTSSWETWGTVWFFSAREVTDLGCGSRLVVSYPSTCASGGFTVHLCACKYMVAFQTTPHHQNHPETFKNMDVFLIQENDYLILCFVSPVFSFSLPSQWQNELVKLKLQHPLPRLKQIQAGFIFFILQQRSLKGFAKILSWGFCCVLF